MGYPIANLAIIHMRKRRMSVVTAADGYVSIGATFILTLGLVFFLAGLSSL